MHCRWDHLQYCVWNCNCSSCDTCPSFNVLMAGCLAFFICILNFYTHNSSGRLLPWGFALEVRGQPKSHCDQKLVMAGLTRFVVHVQERMATLEQQQQQQQGLLSQPLPSLSSPRSHATAALSSASPSRLSLVKSNGSSSGLTAPAAAAPTSSNPVGTPAVVRRTSRSEGGMAERERMYKSEEYTTPTSSSGRRPGLSVLDAFPGGYRSGANTPTATSSSGTRVW